MQPLFLLFVVAFAAAHDHRTTPKTPEKLPIFSIVDRIVHKINRHPIVTTKIVKKIYPIIVKVIDTDGDGNITIDGDMPTIFTQLQDYWTKTLAIPDFVTREAWMGMDADGNGFICPDELSAVISDPTHQLFRPAFAYMFFRRWDTDKDGAMDQAEMERMMAGRFRALIKIKAHIARDEAASTVTIFTTTPIPAETTKMMETMMMTTTVFPATTTLEPIEVKDIFPETAEEQDVKEIIETDFEEEEKKPETEEKEEMKEDKEEEGKEEKEEEKEEEV